VAVAVVVHVVALAVHDPEGFLHLIGPSAPIRAKLASLATVALLLLSVLSLWRKQLNLRYGLWRATHVGLTLVTLVAAVLHSVLVEDALGRFGETPQAWLLLALGAVALVSLIHLRLGHALPSTRTRYRINTVESEQGDAVTVELAADGHDGATFRPGQFAYLRVEGNPLSLDEHPFSYSGSADRRDRPRFTVKQKGAFTSRLSELPEATPMFIDGPYGSFCPDSEASGFLMVCGGMGITPACSLLTTRAEREDPRAHQLILACRTPDVAPMSNKLAELADRLDLEVVVVPSRAPDGWEGESGRLDSSMLRRLVPHDDRFRQAYLCGPPDLVKMVNKTLLDIGIPRRDVHAELFDSA